MTSEEALAMHECIEFIYDIKMGSYMFIAKNAIKKQIPKKPIHNNNKCMCCICGNVFYEVVEDCYYKFCPVCGQAIDWSNDETD